MYLTILQHTSHTAAAQDILCICIRVIVVPAIVALSCSLLPGVLLIKLHKVQKSNWHISGHVPGSMHTIRLSVRPHALRCLVAQSSACRGISMHRCN